MGKAPFTMKGFSYPGKSPTKLDLWKGALGASTPGDRIPLPGGLDITTPVTTAGSAGQIPTGGSSGIDVGQIVRGATSSIPGFGGSGGGIWGGGVMAAGTIMDWLRGRGRRQRRQSKTRKERGGYELSTGSWEDTKPGYVSGATSFMTS